MDLELATVEDIIHELRHRKLQFVLIGVEPTNGKKATIQVGAAGKDSEEVLRLLRVGREVLEESNEPDSYGDNWSAGD